MIITGRDLFFFNQRKGDRIYYGTPDISAGLVCLKKSHILFVFIFTAFGIGM
jgi:hypothetical protein